MIRTIRPLDRPDPGLKRVAKANGFSLHAGVSCEGHERNERERLCRYIARPAVAIPRLSLSSTGKVVYTLKAPCRDGTTQVALDRGGHPPVDFIARLAALVPRPRVNLSRYHGVLACAARPKSPLAGEVTPAGCGKELKKPANSEPRTPAESHAAMTWAQRLKRVFNIDIEVCGHCGGAVRVIACIEDQEAVDRILTHLRQKEQDIPTRPLLAPPTRAPLGTLPLFAGSESTTTTPTQQGRRRVVTAENLMARIVACSRSGMNEDELHDHRRGSYTNTISGRSVNFSRECRECNTHQADNLLDTYRLSFLYFG